jgi:trehalose synthase-fused probable maltokinase
MSSTLECITEWMGRQRWYAGKGHVPRLRELSRETIPTDDPDATILVILVMDDEGHTPTLYQVPVVERTLMQPAARPHLVGENDEGRFVIDGPHDPAYTRAIMRRLAPDLDPASITATRVLSAEQSNTSVIVDVDGVPSIIAKVFRALHHGENPDVTLQAALSEAGSTAVPRFIGALTSEWDDVGRADGRATGNIVFAQEFLAGAEDGWAVALDYAAAARDFTELAADLGRQTAEVHETLARVLPTIDTAPADIAAIEVSWKRRLMLAIREVPVLVERREAIEAVYAAAADCEWPRLQRVHGDFHLGQALLVPDRGWVLVDFEGEPLRPMDERDRPDVALRDVAGMLRSFDYAAGATPGWPTEWARASRAAFLEGYVAASGVDPLAFAALLDAFELDKAVYEAIYEARNRPDWLGIPLRGIEQLVASRLDVTLGG